MTTILADMHYRRNTLEGINIEHARFSSNSIYIVLPQGHSELWIIIDDPIKGVSLARGWTDEDGKTEATNYGMFPSMYDALKWAERYLK